MLVYCADCGKKMYLCRCSTTKQKEFFNCSYYNYRQTVEIFYNFVGAIDRPIWSDELTDEDD